MSTTVLDVPDFFDERFINEILESERFKINELHSDEIADLWGFVKYFHTDGSVKSEEFPMRAFEELCDSVRVDKLRYKVAGIGPKSPNRLAVETSKMDDASVNKNHAKRYDINLDRLRNQGSEVLPEFRIIERSEEKVHVFFDDEVYLSDTGEFVGKDYLGNEYRIDLKIIEDRISLDCEIETFHNNGTTTFVFHLN